MFSKISAKSILSCYFNKKVLYFMSGKLPFERKQGSSSPFHRRPSTNEWLKRQSPKNTNVEQKEPVKEEILQKIVPKEKIAKQAQFKKYQSAPFQRQQPKQQRQIEPKTSAPPLDFSLQVNKLSQREKIVEETVVTNNEVVMSNIGLNRYLTRIYLTSGISLMITLASAYACIALPFLASFSEAFLIGGGALSYFSFKKAQEIRPQFFQEKYKEDTIYRTQNSTERLAIYAVGCIAMGLSSSPLFLSLHETSQIILPMTMGVTAAIFGGASLVGLMLPRSKMLGYGSVLGGGLVGLVGLNCAGMLAAKHLGFTLFANTLTTGQSYLGIGIFTLMLMYDTHTAIKRYEKGDADHLGMSIQILLDIWNIIIRVAKEIAKAKANQDKNKK